MLELQWACTMRGFCMHLILSGQRYVRAAVAPVSVVFFSLHDLGVWLRAWTAMGIGTGAFIEAHTFQVSSFFRAIRPMPLPL